MMAAVRKLRKLMTLCLGEVKWALMNPVLWPHPRND